MAQVVLTASAFANNAACQPQSLNSTFAKQDAHTASDGQNCPNCARLRDQLHIAETTVANLRYDHAWEKRIHATPKDKIGHAVKPAIVALRDLMRSPDPFTKAPRKQDEQGRKHVERWELAQALGTSKSTAGDYLDQMDEAQLIDRNKKQVGWNESETYISEGPNWHAPEQIAPKARQWGGKRIACPSCHSENLMRRVSLICKDCGEIVKTHDSDFQQPSEPPDEPQSLNSPFARHDAPMEDEPDEPRDTLASSPDNVPPADSLGVSEIPSQAQGDVTPAALLALARAYDWPHLPLDDRGCAKVPSGEPAWHAFASGAGADLHRAALQRLQSLAPTP